MLSMKLRIWLYSLEKEEAALINPWNTHFLLSLFSIEKLKTMR